MLLSALYFENINPTALCKKYRGQKIEAKRQRLLCYNKDMSTYWGCGNRKQDGCKRDLATRSTYQNN